MNPTLEEVPKLAGVSRVTVSRVINDQPNVRSEVRECVRQAIQQVGYRPHAVARSLVTRRIGILGAVIPEAVSTLFTDPFFPLLLRGAALKEYYRSVQGVFQNPYSPPLIEAESDHLVACDRY